MFGNKMAILAGDYLLARASVQIARLRNVRVVETMSTSIEHLVRGEVMQMKALKDTGFYQGMDYYMKKNYYKTASLFAHSCKSAILLSSEDEDLVNAGYKYGKHVGLAFQLVDDVLDFEGTQDEMGKPPLNDLRAGHVTAPVLFSNQEEDLMPMMERGFQQDGDLEKTLEIIRGSGGLEKAKDLARVHAEIAVESLWEAFGDKCEGVEYRDALAKLAHQIVDRDS